MRLAPFALATAVACALVAPASGQEKAATKDKDKPEIPWVKTYKDAVAQAKQSNKLIMIDFYTDWCGWCKKLDSDTYTDPKVVALAKDQFVSIKLDAENDGAAQAARYAVTGFPTILFLDPANLPEPGKEKEAGKAKPGEVAGKIVGYMPGEPFAAEMKKINAAAKDLPTLAARVEKDPNDLEAIGRLAAIQHQRGNAARAAELLAQGEKLDPQNAKGQLTRAYNAVGDDLQEAGAIDKALPMFRKAADTAGKDDEAKGYALVSIAVCLASQQKFAEAIPEVEAALKLEGLPRADREQAESILGQLRKLSKSK